jgi:SAM-dependent methyltransferase
MSFYSGIAPYYDLIFPFDEVQAGFLRSAMAHVDRRGFLDIGCATGTILSEFAGKFDKVTGIDLDPALLRLAAEKMMPGEEKKVELLETDMRELSTVFPEEVFSFITCLGNTIPHLGGPGELRSFLKNVHNLLETGGVFVFQTINYDRILDKHVRGLPTIEQNDISFERYYSLPDNRGMITFDIVLDDPSRETEYRDSQKLYPVRKADMEKCLLEVGFTRTQYYGDYSGIKYDEDSALLIGVCSV